MGSLTPLLLLLLAVGRLEARGYFASMPKEEAQNDDGSKITSKLAKSKARELKENMNEINKLQNSVESSPLLQAGGLDPLLTNTADMDVTQQILGQLRELSGQLAALRRSVSNLKYQGHAHYKYMRRVQAACDAAATGTGRGAGTLPHTEHVVGDEQSNMIRTAALRVDPQNYPSEREGAVCPDTFQYNRETRSCYFFGSDRITWRMAREKCMIMGADLVTIETNREQRYITDTARAGSDIRHCDFWTGATDQDSEGHWYWIANKKPLTYSAWNHNEPNNGNGDEHCMHMLWVFGWSWNDARCNYDSACYICEIHRGKAVGGKAEGRGGWE